MTPRYTDFTECMHIKVPFSFLCVNVDPYTPCRKRLITVTIPFVLMQPLVQNKGKVLFFNSSQHYLFTLFWSLLQDVLQVFTVQMYSKGSHKTHKTWDMWVCHILSYSPVLGHWRSKQCVLSFVNQIKQNGTAQPSLLNFLVLSNRLPT